MFKYELNIYIDIYIDQLRALDVQDRCLYNIVPYTGL